MKSLIVIPMLVLTACANNTFVYNPPDQTMDFADFNRFKWDCPHAAEQTAFLKSELVKTTHYQFDNARRAIIYKNLNEIQSACPPVVPKIKSCIHAREDLIIGTGQVTVCDLTPRSAMERPVVNRWEPIVDH